MTKRLASGRVYYMTAKQRSVNFVPMGGICSQVWLDMINGLTLYLLQIDTDEFYRL